MTKVELYALSKSTTLESNKSHDDMLRDVTGVKRGDTLGVSEEPGTWRAVPADLHEAWEERVAIILADGHLRPADAARLAWEGICIKLSVDSLRKYCGFVVVCQTVAQDWRGGASFSRRLDSQTYGGGTGTGEQTAPGELGLKHALHPPRSQRLARPPALQHTPLSGLLHPQCRPHRWTERIIAPHEAPATVERPDGRVGFGGLAGGAMERALPSLQEKGHWPAARIHRPSCGRLPSCGGPRGEKRGHAHRARCAWEGGEPCCCAVCVARRLLSGTMGSGTPDATSRQTPRSWAPQQRGGSRRWPAAVGSKEASASGCPGPAAGRKRGV